MRSAIWRGGTGKADGHADRSFNLCRLKKKLFGSWDRFEVPWPFSRACFVWGEPIWVSADADRQQLEAKRVEVEAALNKLSDDADQLVEDVIR